MGSAMNQFQIIIVMILFLVSPKLYLFYLELCDLLFIRLGDFRNSKQYWGKCLLSSVALINFWLFPCLNIRCFRKSAELFYFRYSFQLV